MRRIFRLRCCFFPRKGSLLRQGHTTLASALADPVQWPLASVVEVQTPLQLTDLRQRFWRARP